MERSDGLYWWCRFDPRTTLVREYPPVPPRVLQAIDRRIAEACEVTACA